MDTNSDTNQQPPPSRIEIRLENAIKEKKYYEAHQIYRTLAFRAINKKQFPQAIKVLKEGSEFLLIHSQYQSGTDLACLITEIFTKHKQQITKSDLNIICSLLTKMLANSEDRANYISKVLDVLTDDEKLLSSFNAFLARKLWQEKSYAESRRCAMLSKDGYFTGCFLKDFNVKLGYTSEVDLFLVQAVLQYLCLKLPKEAEKTFYLYTRIHPKMEPGPPFVKYPLLNFTWFLLLAIHNNYKGSVFSILREHYSDHLKRDPDFDEYLDKIAVIYFGFRPKNGGQQNIFSNMMSLFNGDGLQSLFNAVDMDPHPQELPGVSSMADEDLE
ncbi:Golgi to ER traffic protein 4 [Cichlidogyrus casuarinus]|uniref:Golgi to ER traffic protein 4 n=1 Tax=Cichlidogyrus casuarinus TaxID=1844966 RepID=A0ABD2QBE8_9PLAT